MWRKATGKIVFSRRLEWAFDSQMLVAALNFVYPNNGGFANGLLILHISRFSVQKGTYFLSPTPDPNDDEGLLPVAMCIGIVVVHVERRLDSIVQLPNAHSAICPRSK